MNLVEQILQKLEGDKQLRFKDLKNPKYLRDGICPHCHEDGLWVYRDSPWSLICAKMNSCGAITDVRDHYQDLFENFTKRHPATETDPNASARAFLEYRGLNTGAMADWYTQEQMRLKDGSTAQSIRFKISDDCYWARLINQEDIRRNQNKKAKIVGPYRGECWAPPGQDINDRDVVWITEAIFKSCALSFLGKKTITGLSSNNLPMNFIKRNAGRKITWVIALDNDHAGHRHSPDYKQQLKDLGERVLVAFPQGKDDWDEAYRKRRKNKDDEWVEYLSEDYFKNALWRGAYHTAVTAVEKAFWLYVKTDQKYMVIEHHHKIYRSTIRDKKDDTAMEGFKGRYLNNSEVLYTSANENPELCIQEFKSAYQTTNISNCLPKFLYAEINPQTGEKHYFFRITFPGSQPPALAGLSANDLDCPSNFKRALLSKVTGARFKGVQADLDFLHEEWFDSLNGPEEIRTIPFVGYDLHTGAYAFPEFGYYQGRMVNKNRDGYLAFGNLSLKSSLKTNEENLYHRGENECDVSWYQDLFYVFEYQGLAALSFWTASMFAEQIRQKQEGFTLLEISGDRETGKTTLTKFLWRLLGLKKYEGVDPLKMNERALARKFAQGGNIPLVLIEGDRNESKRRSMFDYDWLKTTWEGGTIRGTGMKNLGLETNEDPFKGSVMVVQNMSIDGSDALLSRFVHLHMTAQGYNHDVEKAIHRLREWNIEKLASYRNRILCDEPSLLKTYFEQYDLAHKKIIERATNSQTKITPRVISNHAQILAWANTLQPVFDGQITDLQLRHFESYLWDRCIERQRRLQSEHPLIQQFWDYFDKLNWKTVMEGGQTYNVEVLNHLPGSGKIAINLTDFDEACGEHKLQRLDPSELKRLFPNSVSRRYMENKAIRSKQSQLNGRTRCCWIFDEAMNG
ncbi:hypothetical protein [Endozoicomonas ascidiicola]|uniref:hypothetical protein n=1 Tax=Endozoicomonas ascidiicola TaxID=1698521 RepID=UPI0008339ABA|nr:hypothetical protein [Endozoicomonas ascidiicola]